MREMGTKITQADSGVQKLSSYLDPEKTHSLAYNPQVKELVKWTSFLINPVLDALYLKEINLE